MLHLYNTQKGQFRPHRTKAEKNIFAFYICRSSVGNLDKQSSLQHQQRLKDAIEQASIVQNYMAINSNGSTDDFDRISKRD